MSNKRKQGESIDVYLARKKNYIATLRKHGLDVQQIAKKLSVSKSAFEKRIYNKPEWIKLWADSNKVLADSVEESFYDRLFKGTQDETVEWIIDEDGERVIIGGKTTIKQTSDNMLQFAMRNLKSAEYNKDKIMDVTVDTNELDPIYDLIDILKGDNDDTDK